MILRVGPSNKELLLNFEHNLMDSEEIFYNKCKSEGVPCSNIIILDKDNRIINPQHKNLSPHLMSLFPLR